jgi:hypothetical protein
VSAPTHDRTSTWISLLRRLTDEQPSWLVLKHPESAFTGSGDVDAAAPRASWAAIESTFCSWAIEHDLGEVISCPHAPGWLHLVALDPLGGRFYELDLNERKVLLGSTFYRAEDLLPLATTDSRGFRRVRPGAEGLIKLIHNGTRRGGRTNPEGLRVKQVLELMAEDQAGVELASALFGRAANAIMRGARACLAGRWDRPSMIAVELRFLLRAPLEPRMVLWRLVFRRRKVRCPVLRTVFLDRRQPPADPGLWIEAVRQNHRVFERVATPARHMPDGS